MRNVVVAAAAVFALMIPAVASAQSASDCRKFARSPDGMWRPLAPVTLNGPNGAVSIGPGATFRPGVAFMGLDLGSWLEANCR